MSDRFTLTAAQTERLLACRAAWEEGEDEERLERLRRREEDVETLQAFAQVLQEADFANGGDLTFAQMTRLLTLARLLAPNPNLDARLLRQPDEPGALNRDLRDLLYGAATLPIRLRGFLQRRAVGGQTASQWLCAAFPREWPLVSQTGLKALELTPEQRASARQTARLRFDLPLEPPNKEANAVPDSDPVLRLLAEVVIYEAAQEVLEAADYIAMHRVLTQGLAQKPGRGRQRGVAPLLYTPHPADSAMTVREEGVGRWALGVGEQETEGEKGRRGERENPTTQLPNYPITQHPTPNTQRPTPVLEFVERAFAEQGFTYPALTARNYYISLQTKPFVLLSGLPGTGKTRLTSLFAEALTGDPTQYRLLPVRPDWTDSTPLLGGFGREGQAVTPFLEFLRRAERPENAHRAYFLCLDEMNLARVEHYFAEILSAMETPTRELLLPDGRALRLPANLFITGTLNAGEVTYPLSRKILDRANILAFHEVCLRDDTPVETGVTVSETRLSASRQATFLHARVMTTSAARAKLKQVGQEEMDLAARALGVMAEVNALLEPHGLHFAYRVRDEILRYCANSFDPEGRGLLTPAAPDNAEANLQTALDLQLTQRVLPRFTGAQEQLETPARDLRLWAERAGFSQTSRRLTRLLARLQREGFVGVEEG